MATSRYLDWNSASFLSVGRRSRRKYQVLRFSMLCKAFLAIFATAPSRRGETPCVTKFSQGTSSFDASRCSPMTLFDKFKHLSMLLSQLDTQRNYFLSKITAGVVHCTFDHFGACLFLWLSWASFCGHRVPLSGSHLFRWYLFSSLISAGTGSMWENLLCTLLVVLIV
jgi:hypothetical protein